MGDGRRTRPVCRCHASGCAMGAAFLNASISTSFVDGADQGPMVHVHVETTELFFNRHQRFVGVKAFADPVTAPSVDRFCVQKQAVQIHRYKPVELLI